MKFNDFNWLFTAKENFARTVLLWRICFYHTFDVSQSLEVEKKLKCDFFLVVCYIHRWRHNPIRTHSGLSLVAGLSGNRSLPGSAPAHMIYPGWVWCRKLPVAGVSGTVDGPDRRRKDFSTRAEGYRLIVTSTFITTIFHTKVYSTSFGDICLSLISLFHA